MSRHPQTEALIQILQQSQATTQANHVPSTDPLQNPLLRQELIGHLKYLSEKITLLEDAIRRIELLATPPFPPMTPPPTP